MIPGTLDSTRIAAAYIMPRQDWLTSPKVMVRLEGEVVDRELFDYFEDEISFSPEEFVGLTVQQGRQLKFNKDKAYLQS